MIAVRLSAVVTPSMPNPRMTVSGVVIEFPTGNPLASVRVHVFAFAALHLPASYSAILNSAAPLFAVLLSALWLDEPLTAPRVAGRSGSHGFAITSS